VLLLLLDPLCDNPQPECVSDVNNGPHNSPITGVADDLVNKSFVDLHFIDGEALEIRQ